MIRQIQKDQPTAAKRRVYFQVNAAGGVAALGEAAGQPQLSTNGGGWSAVGIGTLTAIGFGRYFADLTAAAVGGAGDILSTRYKSANTLETVGDSAHVIGYDPDADDLGLSVFPTAVVFAMRSTTITGDIVSDSVVTFTNAASAVVFAVNTRGEDGSLTPIDLTGKEVKLVVFDPDDESIVKATITGAVSGVDNNLVTVSWPSTTFTDDDVFHFVLRNTDDDGVVLSEGTFIVKRAGVAT